MLVAGGVDDDDDDGDGDDDDGGGGGFAFWKVKFVTILERNPILMMLFL